MQEMRKQDEPRSRRFRLWFDSAVASWATLNFPRDEKTIKEWWPADFITEGHDQTRGWFYSQMGASMVSFGKGAV